jgi:polyribonucleotide nucleotidyltransferase
LYLPGRDEQSNVVRIVGPGDKVKQAAHRLQSIVNELARQSTEKLNIPRAYYPWIRGPYNETIDEIQSKTGAKVNIPPPRAKDETIVISGERDGVQKAAQRIKTIYEEMV